MEQGIASITFHSTAFDETYVGGNERCIGQGNYRRKESKKTPVVARKAPALERSRRTISDAERQADAKDDALALAWGIAGRDVAARRVGEIRLAARVGRGRCQRGQRSLGIGRRDIGLRGQEVAQRGAAHLRKDACWDAQKDNRGKRSWL